MGGDCCVYFERDLDTSSTRRKSLLVTPGTAPKLNLTYYMDKVSSFSFQTPISVHPKVSVDFVLDLFKKLGPRKIIVKHMGLLKGIITRKDLLNCMEGDGESERQRSTLSFESERSFVRRFVRRA